MMVTCRYLDENEVVPGLLFFMQRDGVFPATR